MSKRKDVSTGDSVSWPSSASWTFSLLCCELSGSSLGKPARSLVEGSTQMNIREGFYRWFSKFCLHHIISPCPHKTVALWEMCPFWEVQYWKFTDFVWMQKQKMFIHLYFSLASSCTGQSLKRHRHSLLGPGCLLCLGQTERGKPRLQQLNSKVHRLLFLVVRKQLLPLAWLFTQTDSRGILSSAYKEG